MARCCSIPQLDDRDIVVEIVGDILSMRRYPAHSSDDTFLGVRQVIRSHHGEESGIIPRQLESANMILERNPT